MADDANEKPASASSLVASSPSDGDKLATAQVATFVPMLTALATALAPSLVEVVKVTSQAEIETAKISADADKEARRSNLEHLRETTKIEAQSIGVEQERERGERRHRLMLTAVGALVVVAVFATMLFLLVWGRREDAQILIAFVGGGGLGSGITLFATRVQRKAPPRLKGQAQAKKAEEASEDEEAADSGP